RMSWLLLHAVDSSPRRLGEQLLVVAEVKELGGDRAGFAGRAGNDESPFEQHGHQVGDRFRVDGEAGRMQADGLAKLVRQGLPPGKDCPTDDAVGLLVEELRLVEAGGEEAACSGGLMRFPVLFQEAGEEQELVERVTGESLRPLQRI